MSPWLSKPVSQRIASQGQAELRWVGAVGGREELARLEEAQALEHLLGCYVETWP